MVQLDGGNDGINTVVPYRDEGYAKHRKVLRLPADKLIKVIDSIGLHPSLDDVGKLLESGWLSIVPGVSYPNPSRSHFRSMAVWQTARLDPEEHPGPGWIGRARRRIPSGRGDLSWLGDPSARASRAPRDCPRASTASRISCSRPPSTREPIAVGRRQKTTCPTSSGAACSTPTRPPTDRRDDRAVESRTSPRTASLVIS